MYVCMCVCMYVCMPLAPKSCEQAHLPVHLFLVHATCAQGPCMCMSSCLHVCVCMHVFMYICMHVGTCACTRVYIDASVYCAHMCVGRQSAECHGQRCFIVIRRSSTQKVGASLACAALSSPCMNAQVCVGIKRGWTEACCLQCHVCKHECTCVWVCVYMGVCVCACMSCVSKHVDGVHTYM